MIDEYRAPFDGRWSRRRRSASGHNDDTRQDRVLQFLSFNLESEFIAYMHPKPLIVLPIAYFGATLLFISSMIQKSDLYYELDVTCYAAATLISVAYQLAAWKRGKATPQILALERNIATLIVALTNTKELYLNLRHYRTCDTFTTTVFDDRSVFDEPNCRSWFSPFNVIMFSALVLTQVVLFRTVAIVAAYTIALHCLMWLLYPPPNIMVQVWMYAAYVAAGVCFVTFVRYDQERVQRRQFLNKKKLEAERKRLAEEEQALDGYCSALLPVGFLNRLGTAADSANGRVDSTDLGAVLIVGIHDFGLWCTTSTPVQAAGAMVLLQSNVRNIASKFDMDVAGNRGDSVVCVANLIQNVGEDRVSTIALQTAAELLDSPHSARRQEDQTFPPLQLALNFGRLEGGFVGTLSIRYDVFGSCYNTAQEALLECPPGKIMCAAGKIHSNLVAVGESNQATETMTINDTSFEILDTNDVRAMIVEERREMARSDNSVLSVNRWMQEPHIHQTLRRALADNNMQPTTSFGTIDEMSNSDVHMRLYNASNNSPRSQDKDSQQGQPNSEDLQKKLERYTEERTVWCCFKKFADDEVEQAFVAERMDILPGAASRTWFAYALYILVILILLLVDLHEPRGIIGVVLLILAILMSVGMGVLPAVLSKRRMRRCFFAWSVVGIVIPLLTVYGAAVSRPSAVGNDTRLFLFIGAIVRAYCFTSSRWQAVFVPIALVIGHGQYALPGAQLRISIVFVYWLIAYSILAEREREGSHRENVRRKVEMQFVLARQRATEKLRNGLIRSAVPRVLLNMVVIPGSHGYQSEGPTMGIRAIFTGDDSSSSHQLAIASQRFAPLDELLQSAPLLSISSIFGDQAVVVGPVAVLPDQAIEEQIDMAMQQAIHVAMKLATRVKSASAATSPHISYAILVDYDEIVHALQVTDFAQYWALGVGVTRVLTFMAGTDPSAHSGCLVTERVVRYGNSLGCLADYDVVDTGPMKLRGLGLIRLSKLIDTAEACEKGAEKEGNFGESVFP